MSSLRMNVRYGIDAGWGRHASVVERPALIKNKTELLLFSDLCCKSAFVLQLIDPQSNIFLPSNWNAQPTTVYNSYPVKK